MSLPPLHSPFVPLVRTTRGGLTECLHLGAVALVDTTGRVLAQAGDPHWMAFTRSTLKPFQALPLMQSGAARALALDSRELALLCASHSGEDMHVNTVDGLLQKAGVLRSQLRCGCHVPYRFTFFDRPMPEGLVYDERHHNCSGKHTGFLAYCRYHGLPMADYTEAGHPLQLAVRDAVAQVAGLAPEALHLGIDGCTAPNYTMPLSALGRAFARLAAPSADDPHAEALLALGQAMSDHPELVSGTGRNDADFMRAGRGDWITKVGADGVQVVASRSRQQALVLKVADGQKAALHAATLAALDQLGWLDEAQREALQPWRLDPIRHTRGEAVGTREAVFSLSMRG